MLGTIVSQTLLNILALVLLGRRDVLDRETVRATTTTRSSVAAITPLAAARRCVLLAPPLLRAGRHSRFAQLRELTGQARRALARVRAGLRRLPRPAARRRRRSPRSSRAWVLQWLSCYVLLVALGLDDRAGLGAAAAVLFAVNVTAVLPATPSNLGVFQAACVAVLTGAYGVSQADALGYGIILQAVEIATAVVMGMPALVKEGLSWRDVRLRALHAAPVELRARAQHGRGGEPQPAASEA